MDIIHTKYSTRRFSVRECARLQSMPEDKINLLLSIGISKSQMFKMIANGWNLEVVKHIFKNLPKEL